MHRTGRLEHVRVGRQGANKRRRSFAADAHIIPVPFLPLLALIYRVEEIGTCLAHLDIAHRPEVGHRQTFLRGLQQE
jgi:hypothetical protein